MEEFIVLKSECIRHKSCEQSSVIIIYRERKAYHNFVRHTPHENGAKLLSALGKNCSLRPVVNNNYIIIKSLLGVN